MTSGTKELLLIETSSMTCTLSYSAYSSSGCCSVHAGQSVRCCFALRGKYCTMQTVLHSFAESSSVNGMEHGLSFRVALDTDDDDGIHDG